MRRARLPGLSGRAQSRTPSRLRGERSATTVPRPSPYLIATARGDDGQGLAPASRLRGATAGKPVAARSACCALRSASTAPSIAASQPASSPSRLSASEQVGVDWIEVEEATPLGGGARVRAPRRAARPRSSTSRTPSSASRNPNGVAPPVYSPRSALCWSTWAEWPIGPSRWCPTEGRHERGDELAERARHGGHSHAARFDAAPEMSPATSRLDAPRASSVRTSRSIDTVGSASIFAIRD